MRERSQHVSDLCDAALKRDVEERAEFLDAACRGDADLRREVESLLHDLTLEPVDASGGDPSGIAPGPDGRRPPLARGLVGDRGAAARPSARVKSCPRCQRRYPINQRFCLDDGQPLSLPDPYHFVGRVLADRYRIDALVGLGGMGAVYSAWHLAIDRRVAVKILQPNIAMLDERMVSLFEREAKTVGHLNHENVTNVLDAGRTTDGTAFIAMEWLEGPTLEEELAVSGVLSFARTGDLLCQITAALDAAHAAHIIHRDLKPANVMLVKRADGRERVKVVDFGIAKALDVGGQSTHTAGSMVIGTPAYASPEQLSGRRDIDPRSDIYSLGVMLYRMLTGVLPFHAASVEELITMKLRTPPAPARQLRPDMPLAIEQLLDRMLATEREERPATANDVNALFAQAIQIESTPVRFSAPRHVDVEFEPAEWQPSPILPPHSMADAPERLPSQGPDETVDPLLSELDFSPRLQQWARTHRGGWTLAVVAALGAVGAILLSHAVGSACIHVTLRAVSSGAQETLVFGYVAEPNAALWYLVGVPVFVILTAHFFNLAHSSLRELSAGERLTVVRGGRVSAESPLELIGKRNRWWFRKLVPAIVLLAVAAVYIPEYVAAPGPAFGWVGALSIKDYEGASLTDLRAQKKIGLIPAIARLCGTASSACDVRVAGVIGGHGAADRKRWIYPFLVFVIVALGLQVLFSAFGVWVAAKVLFLFGLLTYALINRSAPGLKIELDFEDTELRFGLGALDVVHNMVLLLVIVASVVFLLQRATNVAKGSSFFAGMIGVPLVSQLGPVLASLLPFMLVVVAPIAAFMILMETEVGRAVGAIERERALLRRTLAGDTPRRQKAALESAEEHLRHKRDLARQQRPWPRKNPTYRALLLTAVVMLVVLPFAVEYTSVSGGIPTFSAAFAQFSEILCRLL